MGIVKDITGQRFGRLTVIKKCGINKHNAMMWLCQCECGTIKELSKKKLLDKKQYFSCGCLYKEERKQRKEQTKLKNIKIKEEKRALRIVEEQERVQRKEEKQKEKIENKLKQQLQKQQEISLMIGKRFDMLEITQIIDNQHFLCKCDCGNSVVKDRQYLSYNGHKKKSCGCYKDKYNHGMYNTRFYNIWRGVKKRCYQKSRKDYHNYGGRGIVMSESWKTFINFYNDMYELYLEHCEEFGEDNTSIDRINVDGNYCKENCKWSTRSEQAKNKRPRVCKN